MTDFGLISQAPGGDRSSASNSDVPSGNITTAEHISSSNSQQQQQNGTQSDVVSGLPNSSGLTSSSQLETPAKLPFNISKRSLIVNDDVGKMTLSDSLNLGSSNSDKISIESLQKGILNNLSPNVGGVNDANIDIQNNNNNNNNNYISDILKSDQNLPNESDKAEASPASNAQNSSAAVSPMNSDSILAQSNLLNTDLSHKTNSVDLSCPDTRAYNSNSASFASSTIIGNINNGDSKMLSTAKSMIHIEPPSKLAAQSLQVKSETHVRTPISSLLANTHKIKDDELTEIQSQWLHEILIENPHFLAMRERSLPLSGGFSFANVTHTTTVSALAALNRRSLLELISQHLQSIGMYRTAEILSRESGHSFQASGQPWDRTDLHLLTSLALSSREDPWNLPPDMSHRYVIEALEEDFFSSPYREDPSTIWDEYFDPELNVIYETTSNSTSFLPPSSLSPSSSTSLSASISASLSVSNNMNSASNSTSNANPNYNSNSSHTSSHGHSHNHNHIASSNSIYNTSPNIYMSPISASASHSEGPVKHTYQNIKAASLKRLIVYHVTSDIQSIPDEEQQMFFLTIHSITSSEHFLRHLVTLFDCDLSGTVHEDKQIAEDDFFPIRRNIINLIKKWTSFHGLFIGKRTLKAVSQFLNRISSSSKFSAKNSAVLKIFIDGILKSLPTLEYGMRMGSQGVTDRAPPIIKNEHIIFKPNLTILDPEPQEVARQITLIYHEKYASIHSLEFIIGISNRHSTIQTPTLNEFFKFGDHLSHLIAETFLNSEKKPEAFLRLFEIAQSLAQLNNYEALSCFVNLLKREEFMALGKASDQQRAKLIEMWKDTGEDDKLEKVRPTVYENNISKIFSEWGSAIPNMHAELKRGDKELRKKPDLIDGLINWEKVREVAQRCTVLYRFQNQSYNLWTIPQIAKAILREPKNTEEDLEAKIDELCKLVKS